MKSERRRTTAGFRSDRRLISMIRLHPRGGRATDIPHNSSTPDIFQQFLRRRRSCAKRRSEQIGPLVHELPQVRARAALGHGRRLRRWSRCECRGGGRGARRSTRAETRPRRAATVADVCLPRRPGMPPTPRFRSTEVWCESTPPTRSCAIIPPVRRT